MGWSCYLLLHPSGRTYIGATVDPDHRLRQHNRELVGGAKATTRLVKGSDTYWCRVCRVSGFPDMRAALQFEYRWKRLSRVKRLNRFKKEACCPLRTPCNFFKPVERRLVALGQLLRLSKPTSRAVEYAEYPDGLPVICWDSSDSRHKMLYWKFYPVKISLRPKN